MEEKEEGRLEGEEEERRMLCVSHAVILYTRRPLWKTSWGGGGGVGRCLWAGRGGGRLRRRRRGSFISPAERAPPFDGFLIPVVGHLFISADMNTGRPPLLAWRNCSALTRRPVFGGLDGRRRLQTQRLRAVLATKPVKKKNASRMLAVTPVRVRRELSTLFNGQR